MALKLSQNERTQVIETNFDSKHELSGKEWEKSDENLTEVDSTTCQYDMYESLVTLGADVIGQAEQCIPLDDIKWLDRDLIVDGIRFFEKHRSVVCFTTLVTMTLGLSMKCAGTAFYGYGDAMTSKGQFIRFLCTQHGFAQFYERINDTPKEINKFFRKLWRMHAFGRKRATTGKPMPELLPEPEQWEIELAEVITKDLDHIHNPEEETVLKKINTWSPDCAISQLDMSIAALNSFSAMWLHPKKHGLRDSSELKGFIHISAIVARFLGVRDEFNICLAKDERVFRRLFDNAVIGSLKNIDSFGVHLLNQSITGLSTIVPCISIRGFVYGSLRHVLEVEGYTGENIWKLMNWRDKVTVAFVKFYYFLLGIPGSNVVINKIYSIYIKFAERRYLPKKVARSQDQLTSTKL